MCVCVFICRVKHSVWMVMAGYLADRQRTRDGKQSKAFFLVSKTDFFSSTPSHCTCTHNHKRAVTDFFSTFFSFVFILFFAPNFACLLKSYISIYTQKLEHFFHKHTKTLKTERQKCASSIFSSSCCARTSTLSNWKKIHIFSPALAFNAYTCLFMCICVFVSKFFFSPRRLYWTVEQQSGPKKKSYNKASPSSVVLILDGMKTKE